MSMDLIVVFLYLCYYCIIIIIKIIIIIIIIIIRFASAACSGCSRDKRGDFPFIADFHSSAAIQRDSTAWEFL